jgi:hypothetical protein
MKSGTSRKFGASRSGNSLLRPLSIGDFVTSLAKHLRSIDHFPAALIVDRGRVVQCEAPRA